MQGFLIYTHGAIKDIRETDLRQILALNGAVAITKEELLLSISSRAMSSTTLVLFDGTTHLPPSWIFHSLNLLVVRR